MTVIGYLFGTGFNQECYILSSSTKDFTETDAILFYVRDKKFKHRYPIYLNFEIYRYKLHNQYYLFPLQAFNNFCGLLLKEERLIRGLNLIIGANQNDEYSISRCILYILSIETISGLIKDVDIIAPINNDRFEKSDIVNKLIKVVDNSKELNSDDKSFLIEKKLRYINSPANADKIESILTHFRISLPKKFKKVLNYRNYYLHGSIPKGSELGSSESDNFNRGFELQFIANILILKHIGYEGFLKNYSYEMEYLNNKRKGIERDIKSQSLYYRI